MSLGDYLTDTAALLHDNGFRFTSQTQLTRWINTARRAAAKHTGCVQRLISGASAFGAGAQPGSMIPGAGQPGALPGSADDALFSQTTNTFTTIPGVERYPYTGFANPYLQTQHEGCDLIIDVASLSVNWGGAVRPSLAWLPWEDFQAYGRAYATLIESYPYYWSTFNPGSQGEVWFFPTPSIAGDMEWLVYAVPKNLNSNEDFDTIPDGFREAIKFGAAALAFLTSQRYAQAQMMDGLFAQSLGLDTMAADRGKIPNFYWSSF